VDEMPEHKNYIKTIDEKGSINISEDVVAAIIASATAEVAGVHGLYYSPSKEISQGISRKGIAKSVKLQIDGEKIVADVYILLAREHCANDVGQDVQEAVITAVEDSVGATISTVNVHICGVVLKKKPQPTAEK
jgi:uncharacterized alkaline shock family protein YloU